MPRVAYLKRRSSFPGNWRNNALNRYSIICCAQTKCSNIVVFLIIFLTLIELRRWKKKKIWKLQVTAYCSTRNKTRVKLYYLFLLRIITRCRNTRCIIIKVFSRYANICLSLCLQCALLCISFLRESTPRWPWIFLISAPHLSRWVADYDLWERSAA